ncbi:MAG: hypothetical protein OXC94_02905 [Chloroflexi bacterium]|nr:hypothetical protein [Chloroflexota bacterium]
MAALVLLVLSLAAAGCSDPPTQTARPASTPTATPTPGPAATPASTPTATPTPGPAARLAPAPTPEESIESALAEYIPWYGDPPYPLAVAPIRELWHRDAELGRAVAQAPWIADGLDHWEEDAVYGLQYLFDHDPALARRVLAYTLDEPVRSRDTLLPATLGRMSREHRDTFKLLIGQTWFADGLDAEERAFIVAVSHTTGVDGLYRGLLAERFSRSGAISLPLAGEVTLWAFSNDAPPTGEVLALAQRAVRGAEGIMGAPFPLDDLIILSLDVDGYDIAYGGVNWGDSVVLLRGERLLERDYGELLYHEIAHYWLPGEIGPFWLYEGGANMVAAYLLAGGRPLEVDENMVSYCRDHGVPDIHAVEVPDHPDPVAQSTCCYLFGQYFLTTLFHTVGEAAFSSAMRELYEAYASYEPPATDEQVYRVFLGHTPPDRRAAFLDAYRRLHGGPFLPVR